MIFCNLLRIKEINFFKKFFQDYHQSVKLWIQIRPYILSPNSLQTLLAHDTSRENEKVANIPSVLVDSAAAVVG